MERTSPTLRRMRRSASQNLLPVTATTAAPRATRHRQRFPRTNLQGGAVYGEVFSSLWITTRKVYGKAGYHGGVAVAGAFGIVLLCGFWISRSATADVSNELEESSKWENHSWQAGLAENEKMSGTIGYDNMLAMIEEKKKLGAKIHGTEYKAPGSTMTSEEIAARHANHVEHMHPRLSDNSKYIDPPEGHSRPPTHNPYFEKTHMVDDDNDLHDGDHHADYRYASNPSHAHAYTHAHAHATAHAHGKHSTHARHSVHAKHGDHSFSTVHSHSSHAKPGGHSETTVHPNYSHDKHSVYSNDHSRHSSHHGSKEASSHILNHEAGKPSHPNYNKHSKPYHKSGPKVETDQRMVIYVEKKQNGFGAQLLRIIDARALATKLGADLILHKARFWNYGCGPWRGWECYFRPLTYHTYHPPSLSKCTEFSHVAAKDLHSERCIKISTPESSTRARLAHIQEGVSQAPIDNDLNHDKGEDSEAFLPHVDIPKGRFNQIRETAISAALMAARKHQKLFHKSPGGGILPKNAVSLPLAQAYAAKVFRLSISTNRRVLQRLLSSGLDIRHRESVVWSARQQRLDYEKHAGHVVVMVKDVVVEGHDPPVHLGPFMAGKEPYVGVHLRRGDKHKEVPDVPLSKYVEAIDIVSHKAVPVFIASDDGKALKALKEILEKSGRTVLHVAGAEERRGHQQSNANMTPLNHNRPRVEALLADIQALSKCDYFIGTFSSNLGRLVHVLRQHRAPQTSISVDTKWATGVAFTTFQTHYCDADDASLEYCSIVKRGKDLSHIVAHKDPILIHNTGKAKGKTMR